MLNCDYKIAAKVIANRIKPVLPSVISEDQTGFLKGRFIGENIRLIDSIISYCEKKNIPGLLLFVDFEKAFDTLEWNFLQKTISHFNFGPSLLRWVKLFYTDIESCILNNGWCSDLFRLERGVRQGCPLSPYLFILCAEMLANAVRKDTNIKGIKVNNIECKISQYADDTTMLLDGSKKSLQACLTLFQEFALISGLSVNSDKTEALWIGSLVGSSPVCPEYGLKWATSKVRALGIWFCIDSSEAVAINYREKKKKIEEISSCWQVKRLTLLGRITVIKSLLVSQLVYVMSSLPTCQKTLQQVNLLLFKFLWRDKNDKVKCSTVIEKGGLKMV